MRDMMEVIEKIWGQWVCAHFVIEEPETIEHMVGFFLPALTDNGTKSTTSAEWITMKGETLEYTPNVTFTYEKVSDVPPFFKERARYLLKARLDMIKARERFVNESQSLASNECKSWVTPYHESFLNIIQRQLEEEGIETQRTESALLWACDVFTAQLTYYSDEVELTFNAPNALLINAAVVHFRWEDDALQDALLYLSRFTRQVWADVETEYPSIKMRFIELPQTEEVVDYFVSLLYNLTELIGEFNDDEIAC